MKYTPVKVQDLCVGDIVYRKDIGALEVVSIKVVTRSLYELRLASDAATNPIYHRKNGGAIYWSRRNRDYLRISG